MKQSPNSKEYILQNGIINCQQGSVLQMVVLQKVRHSNLWDGHLGKQNTIARIKCNFYWPGLFRKSCPQCQMTYARKPLKALLQPLPVIGSPFERFRMDIVGPV